MKKLIISCALALASVSAVNAQLFVGGAVNFSQSGSSSTNAGSETEGNSYMNFTIEPEVGYSLSEKLAVGLGFGYGTYKNEFPGSSTITSTNNWSINPFARYYFASFGKLNLFCEGKIGIGGSTGETKILNVTTESDPTSYFSFNIVPALEYQLSEKFSLEAQLNFLNLGFNRTVTTDAADDANFDESFNFNIGLNSGNISNLGAITIGFVYKL